MDKNIKTIIFDLGGVLIDWDPRNLYRRLFSDQEEMEYFLKYICTPEWNAQMDQGKPFQEAMDELSAAHPEYSVQIQAYLPRWEEMLSGPIGDSVKILGELKNLDCHLTALSNWSKETFPRVADRFEFLDWFDPLVISGELGLVKPDPDIFFHLLELINKKPGDCLFVDDSRQNIRLAEELGFYCIHFQSPGQLRSDLEKLGILDNGQN
jgi:2-haloacid dehalogenase